MITTNDESYSYQKITKLDYENQLQMIKRFLTSIIIDYFKYMTDKMKAQIVKSKVPSSISQQILSQKIIAARQKTKEISADEKILLMQRLIQLTLKKMNTNPKQQPPI